jgi:hypothetical protein
MVCFSGWLFITSTLSGKPLYYMYLCLLRFVFHECRRIFNYSIVIILLDRAACAIVHEFHCKASAITVRYPPNSDILYNSSFPSFHPSPTPLIHCTPTNSNPFFATNSSALKLLLSTNSSPPTSALSKPSPPAFSSNSRKRYRCGPLSSLGPGARYGVRVFPFAAMSSADAGESMGMEAMTQWRQYPNLGSSGVGASGSIIMNV